MQRFFSRRTFFLLLLVFQRIIMPRIDRFQPFGRGFFTGTFHRQMAEPAVRLRAVPMLDVGRNRHHVSWLQAAGRLVLFLIPALTVYADEQLTAAVLCAMDVPVVAEAGLKGYVGNKDRLFRLGQGVERALASEEPGIGIVGAQALGQPAQNAT